jgi:hypothetical protein
MTLSTRFATNCTPGSGGSAGSSSSNATISTAGAELWPDWAVPQLLRGAEIASGHTSRAGHPGLATEIYRQWFAPSVDSGEPRTALAGIYRTAHAASALRTEVADIGSVLRRQDALGRDGWWRTWGTAWVPTRSRSSSVRVLFTPRSERLADFVWTVTAGLYESSVPWLLACATDPRRMRRLSSAVLYVPDPSALPTGMFAALEPLLVPELAPLCRQVAPGVGFARDPGNGMSFGEHRSHLLAVALHTRRGRRVPLAAAASVFRDHGLDPLQPHL